MKQDRQRQVKILKQKGRYPYNDSQTRQNDGLLTLSQSGSQSMNGPFYNVSSRSHLQGGNLPKQMYSSPENGSSPQMRDVYASADAH